MNKKLKILSVIAVLSAFGGASAVAFGGCSGSDSESGTDHTHTYGQYTTVLASTCTSQGYQVANCTANDGAVDYQLLPVDSTAHSYGDWQVTAYPTATAKGTATRYCKYNTSHTDTMELPVLSEDNYTIATTDGVNTYTLKSDTTVKFTAVGASSSETEHTHEYVWETVLEASCAGDGYKKGVCSVCGDIAYEAIVADSTSHAYGAWQVSTAPTSTRKGVIIRYCSYGDGSFETLIVPALSDEGYTVTEKTAETSTAAAVNTYTITVDGKEVSFDMTAEAASVETAVNMAVANADKVIGSEVTTKDSAVFSKDSFTTNTTYSSYVNSEGEVVDVTRYNVNDGTNEMWFEENAYGELVGYVQGGNTYGAGYTTLAPTDSRYVKYSNGYAYYIKYMGLGSSTSDAYAHSPEELLSKLYALGKSGENVYSFEESVSGNAYKVSYLLAYDDPDVTSGDYDIIVGEVSVSFTLNSDGALEKLSVSIGQYGKASGNDGGWVYVEANEETGAAAYYYIKDAVATSGGKMTTKSEYSLSVEQRTANCQYEAVDIDEVKINKVTLTNTNAFHEEDNGVVADGATISALNADGDMKVTLYVTYDRGEDLIDFPTVYVVTKSTSTDADGKEVVTESESELPAVTGDVYGSFSLYDDDNNRIHELKLNFQKTGTYIIRLKTAYTSTTFTVKAEYDDVTELTAKVQTGSVGSYVASDIAADTFSGLYADDASATFTVVGQNGSNLSWDDVTYTITASTNVDKNTANKDSVTMTEVSCSIGVGKGYKFSALVPGTYTVTLSLKSNPAVSTSFDITVNESEDDITVEKLKAAIAGHDTYDTGFTVKYSSYNYVVKFVAASDEGDDECRGEYYIYCTKNGSYTSTNTGVDVYSYSYTSSRVWSTKWVRSYKNKSNAESNTSPSTSCSASNRETNTAVRLSYSSVSLQLWYVGTWNNSEGTFATWQQNRGTLVDMSTYHDVSTITTSIYDTVNSKWVEAYKTEKVGTIYANTKAYIAVELGTATHLTDTNVTYEVKDADGEKITEGYTASTATVDDESCYAFSFAAAGTYKVTFTARSVNNQYNIITKTVTIVVSEQLDVSAETMTLNTSTGGIMSSVTSLNIVADGADVTGEDSIYKGDTCYFWVGLSGSVNASTPISVTLYKDGVATTSATIAAYTAGNTELVNGYRYVCYTFTAKAGGTYTVTVTATGVKDSSVSVSRSFVVDVTKSYELTSAEWSAFLTSKFTYDETAGTYSWKSSSAYSKYYGNCTITITPASDGKSGTIVLSGNGTSSSKTTTTYNYTLDEGGLTITLVGTLPTSGFWASLTLTKDGKTLEVYYRTGTTAADTLAIV